MTVAETILLCAGKRSVQSHQPSGRDLAETGFAGLGSRSRFGGPRNWPGPGLVFVALLMWSVVALLPASPARADRTIEGRVTVVRDVDTIVVAGTPVRLNGVDGPEASTGAGREARAFMERLLRGRIVFCVLNGDRTYDRWVGTCYLDGHDIGALAIANGHALDCPRYSGGRYIHLETPASRARLSRAGYCR